MAWQLVIHVAILLRTLSAVGVVGPMQGERGAPIIRGEAILPSDKSGDQRAEANGQQKQRGDLPAKTTDKSGAEHVVAKAQTTRRGKENLLEAKAKTGSTAGQTSQHSEAQAQHVGKRSARVQKKNKKKQIKKDGLQSWSVSSDGAMTSGLPEDKATADANLQQAEANHTGKAEKLAAATAGVEHAQNESVAANKENATVSGKEAASHEREVAAQEDVNIADHERMAAENDARIADENVMAVDQKVHEAEELERAAQDNVARSTAVARDLDQNAQEAMMVFEEHNAMHLTTKKQMENMKARVNASIPKVRALQEAAHQAEEAAFKADNDHTVATVAERLAQSKVTKKKLEWNDAELRQKRARTIGELKQNRFDEAKKRSLEEQQDADEALVAKTETSANADDAKSRDTEAERNLTDAIQRENASAANLTQKIDRLEQVKLEADNAEGQ